MEEIVSILAICVIGVMLFVAIVTQPLRNKGRKRESEILDNAKQKFHEGKSEEAKELLSKLDRVSAEPHWWKW